LKLICRVCTAVEGSDRIILRASKAGHLQSAVHKESVRRQAESSRNSQNTSVPVQAAQLTFVETLGLGPAQPLEPSRRPPSPGENPFNNVVQYDNEFFDKNDQQILFSAGRSLDDAEREEQEEIQRQIHRIALLPEHSLFGQTSSVQAAADHENDTVDGAFAAALQRMGMFM
jgi:hypothetical protein